MNTTYLRGQLYYADLSKGVGSEQEGYRPVLIIQNDVGNKYSPTVIVAAVTSKVGVKPKLPTHYFIEAGTVGLTAPSIVLLEQLRTLDKRRLERYIGRVDSRHIREINRALAISVGLMEEMPENLMMCLCPTCANNFLAQVLIFCAGSIPAAVRKMFAPTAASAGDLIMKSSGAASNGRSAMEKVLLSVKEMMAYTGWGENKVRALLNDPTMPFSYKDKTNRLQCNKRLFDKWLDSQCGKQCMRRL